MNDIKTYYRFIEIKSIATQGIEELRTKGCLCQNDYNLDSGFCGNEFDNLKCYKCGFEYSTRKCHHNQFRYTCPDCGASLT